MKRWFLFVFVLGIASLFGGGVNNPGGGGTLTAGVDYIVPGVGTMKPSTVFEQLEEFTSVLTLTSYSASGDGTPVAVWGATAARPGNVRFTTNSSSTNRAGLHDGQSDGWLFGAGETTMEFAWMMTNLSDGTETFTDRLGWGDNLSGDSADGVYFRYTHSVNSGNWQLVARSNSTETATNSSSGPVAGTWYRFTIVVNGTGTSAEFFINGTSVGTVTSNIPTAAGRECGVYFTHIKSAGTTARLAWLDYIYLKKVFSTPR